MKPVYLKLEGFKGIRSGLGVDAIELDIGNLPEGLVAITGSNGRGKTTILDNLHPYRIMPYKMREKKDWSPSAFSYYDQVAGRGRKTLVFDMGGERYRSVITIDGTKRQQEAFLYRQDGEEWVAVNDGKVATYDHAIETICGSPTLFFSSQFRGQDARRLSSYPRAEILGIITELLMIDHIRRQGEKAQKVVEALKKHKSSAEAGANDARSRLASLSSLRNDAAAKHKEVAKLKKTITTLESREAKAAARVADAQAKASVCQELERQLQDLDKQEQSIRQDMARLEARVKELKREYANEVYAAGRQHHTRIAAIDDEIGAARKTIETLTRTLGEMASLAEAEKLLPVREKEYQEAMAVLDRCRDEYRKTMAHIQALTAEQGRLGALAQRLAGLREKRQVRLQAAMKERDENLARAAMLQRLDCFADGSGRINDGCPLLGDAIAAKGRLGEIEKRVAALDTPSPEELELDAACRNMAEVVAELGRQQKKKADSEAEGKRLAADCARMEKELGEIRARLAQLADRRATEERLAAARRTLERLEADKRSSTEAHTAQLQAAAARVSAACDQVNKEIARHAATLGALSRKRDQTAARIQRHTLPDDAIRALDDIRGELREARERLDGAIREEAYLQAELQNLEKETERLDVLLGVIARLNDLIRDWQVVANACGNDGIIALEVDDAGPSITSIANELLEACYGDRFSVRIETQSEKVTGGMKETFDIIVYDSERDEVRSIREMSGGEVTYIEDAVTRAIALYNTRRAGYTYDTMYSDEHDGSLDAAKKHEFVAIKRKAMEMGGHSREFFISQTPELCELADAVIPLDQIRAAGETNLLKWRA